MSTEDNQSEEDNQSGGGDQFDPNPKQQEVLKKPKNKLIVIIIAVSVVAVIAIGAFFMPLIKEKISDKAVVPKVVVPPNFKDALDLKTKKQIKDENEQQKQQTINQAVGDKKRQQELNKLTQQIAALKDNKQIIQQLQTVISGLSGQIQQANDRVSSLEKSVLTQNYQQKNYQETINKKILSLQQIIKDNQKQQNKNTNNQDVNKIPPFELVSVDQWGDHPQATIRYQGKFGLLKIGDTRFNWKITELSFAKETAKFKNLVSNNEVVLFKVK